MPQDDYQLTQTSWGYKVSFVAMASSCELLIKTCEIEIAKRLAHVAVMECRRIESKYSRYLANSCLSTLNDNSGRWQQVDDETAALLHFSQQCYQMSDGLFDITAGAVLALWSYNRQSVIPNPQAISQALKHVGFDKIQLASNRCFIPSGMRLDFGGLGKEYACDRIATELRSLYPALPVLVNLGGDICCSVPNKAGWQVGLEDPDCLNRAGKLITLTQGALATSGNTRRVIHIGGKTYGHIIDPTSGYPVDNAPISVSVFGENCIIAGMLSTIALLKGNEAIDFLAAQAVEYEVVY